MRSQAAADAAEEAAVHQPSAAGRRKGTASRSWLVVSASGRTNMEEVGKHSIMRRTGLPARDLRVLDPLLSYPSTILGRERAIVINLLHIKAIVTAAEVLVSNPKGQLVEAFVDELRSRLAGSGHQLDLALSDMEAGKTTSLPPSSTGNNGTKHAMKISDEHPTSPTNGETVHSMDGCKDGGTKVLSFEFRALEVCLESACMCLESETLSLEQEAYPALDELTSKISTLNLQRVREIKNRLVAISGRVQKVRDEIEHLLDDDMDMAEMFLTEKLLYQPVGETSFRDDIDDEAIDLDDNDEDKDEGLKIETESNRGSLAGFKPNIEELEMLLEAYFVQVDGTLNKLSTLREYVDDTEDYINIMLDEKQNQLLQMGVMLSTATLVVTAGVVVVGIFGMNIGIDLFNAPFFKFWVTTFGTIGGCVILYILAIGWGKKSGLLQ